MLAASTYMIVFRLIHIVAGVIWVGGLALLVLFIQPAGKSLGPQAGPFVMELLGRRRLPIFLLAVGAVTIVSGGFLYWHDWHLFDSFGDWVSTSNGYILTLGAAAAVIAWLIGLLRVKPTMQKTLALAGSLAAGPQPPPQERLAEVQALQLQARRLSIAVFTLLVFAVLAMSTARYW
jgi:uncharacterized membrane protein